MKLYKVTYETEVVILAEDDKEVISYAGYCVKEEMPRLMDWEVVESMEQIPNWNGSIPYHAKMQYNINQRRCEEFVMENYGGNTPIVPDETMEELLKNGVKK
jgi:hypothetical protein